MGKLLQLVKRGISQKPVRVVLYGPEGGGKTTLASEAPSPIFLGTEDGFGLLDVPRFPEPRTWQQLLDSVDELTREEHPYRTIVVDTLDHIEPLVWAHVCAEAKVQSIEEVGGGFGKGYLAALGEWRKLLARLDAARARGLTVILLAHAAIKTFKNPEGPDYDRFGLKINEKAAALVREWCDALFFLRFEDVVEKEKRNDKKGKASGGQRVLYTERTPAFDAKNRYGMEPAYVMQLGAMWSTCASSFQRSAEDPQTSALDVLRAEMRALANGNNGLARKVELSIEKHGDNVAGLEAALENLKNVVNGTSTAA